MAHLGICQEEQVLKRWKSSLENLFDRKRSCGGKKLLLSDLLGSMTKTGLGYYVGCKLQFQGEFLLFKFGWHSSQSYVSIISLLHEALCYQWLNAEMSVGST